MAFDANFLSMPELDRELNKRSYRYRTTDSSATVSGSGYFAGCADGGANDRDMSIGDEILVEVVDSISAPTTLVPLYFAVSSISGTDVSVSISSSTPGSHTHAASDVVSGTFADARISEASVTQHEAALSIAGSQLTGTILHERGGLEADVSAYSGLVKISGGVTSQAVGGTDYANASHTHPASDITSGTLVHERGGLEADVSAYDGFVRITGGATSNVTAATGWGDPSGTATRTTFASFAGQTISASPTQGEVQNIDDHVVVLSERLMALITDLKSKGYLSS